jgi:hypothetical protein
MGLNLNERKIDQMNLNLNQKEDISNESEFELEWKGSYIKRIWIWIKKWSVKWFRIWIKRGIEQIDLIWIKKWIYRRIWIWIKRSIDQMSLNLNEKEDRSNESEFKSKRGSIKWI